jgi:hypothetical protein
MQLIWYCNVPGGSHFAATLFAVVRFSKSPRVGSASFSLVLSNSKQAPTELFAALSKQPAAFRSRQTSRKLVVECEPKSYTPTFTNF